MHSLRKNQQKLWYSTYADQMTIYERDENGNIAYDEVDGELTPKEIATRECRKITKF